MGKGAASGLSELVLKTTNEYKQTKKKKTELIMFNLPPQEDYEDDASSVNPLSQRIGELWGCVWFTLGVEVLSR